MRTLDELEFDNTYGRLPGAFYSRLDPTPFDRAFLVSFNPDAARLLGLHPDEAAKPEFVDYFSGRRRLPGADPLAMCYAGHQFGSYVPRLGDGRAILLGEVRNPAGEKWDLHLKGGGPTPYSRSGDGRAVLRSTIREYLCGEAMHGLGIPTSRALCIIGSDEAVYREDEETAALLVRLAPSHVRFGSFEYFFYTEQVGHLRRLADYVIAEHYPWLDGREDKYLGLLDEVIARTARLIARWQAVGFAHGVMNTDNMSILGLTLDYGPYGFLDTYQPGFVCNHSDHWGRYAFDRQPSIGLFNLSCLAQALLPLLAEEPEAAVEMAKDRVGRYETLLVEAYAGLMRDKLGLREVRAEDRVLCADLLALMENATDYTIAFRALAAFSNRAGARNTAIRDLFMDREGFDAWAARYGQRLAAEGSDDGERRERMQCTNPKYILRNYLAETAIRRAVDEGDYAEIDRLLALLRDPFGERPEWEAYAAPPPDWAQHIEVSCSS